MTAIVPEVLPLPPRQWREELSHVLDDMNGSPINVHQLMANNPALLNAWWNFRNYSVEGGTLGKRAGELVILRVAVHMQAWYEWGSHVDRALACGLKLDEINRVLTYNTHEKWSAADAALLRAVDELVTEHALSRSMQIELADFYDTAQIMDIIAIQGMYIILACMINSWGLALDTTVQERIADQANEHEFMKAAELFKASVTSSAA